MFDPREIPAFWGLCGAMLCGFVGVVTAYSAKAGNPLAQRRAWLRLLLGLFAGPIMAEALTVHIVIKIIPLLDMRGVALTLGWMVANDPKAIFEMLSRVIRALFNNKESEQ